MQRANQHIKEIDSLRAIAVMAVVLFHVFPSLLPGGFIGVDIFFVISGFVIARSYLFPLLSEERTLREFYLARFRRLAPALATVLVATTLAAVIILPPDRLVAYAWSLAAQVLYLQNFVFWAEGDYFEGSLMKPLLHTWSLAVEEQFYILWAVLILILRRFPRLLWTVLIFGALVSVVAGIGIEPRSPKTAFYILPTRIWEFAFGIVAFLVARRYVEPQPAWFGMVMPSSAFLVAALVGTTIFFPEGAAFPGPHSIIACSATALLLVLLHRHSGHPSLFWMRVPPVIYVGRVSYGFYLWHWPPLALYAIKTGDAAAPGLATALIFLSFFAAVVSFHLVEEPIRRRQYFLKPWAILNFVGISSAASIAIAALFIGTSGLLSRYPAELRPFLIAPDQRGTFRCGKIYPMLHPTAQTCPLVHAAAQGGKAVLILGDSHADVLKEMIADVGHSLGRNVYLTVRNCDLGRFDTRGFCSQAVLNEIIAEARNLGVSEVIAISYWEPNKFTSESMASDITTLLKAGMNVTIVRQVPDDPGYDPRTRAYAALAGAPLDLAGIKRSDYQAANRKIDGLIDGATARFPHERVRIVSPADLLCPQKRCLYQIDGVPLYLDDNHLTFTGARKLQPMFVSLLAQ